MKKMARNKAEEVNTHKKDLKNEAKKGKLKTRDSIPGQSGCSNNDKEISSSAKSLINEPVENNPYTSNEQAKECVTGEKPSSTISQHDVLGELQTCGLSSDSLSQNFLPRSLQEDVHTEAVNKIMTEFGTQKDFYIESVNKILTEYKANNCVDTEAVNTCLKQYHETQKKAIGKLMSNLLQKNVARQLPVTQNQKTTRHVIFVNTDNMPVANANVMSRASPVSPDSSCLEAPVSSDNDNETTTNELKENHQDQVVLDSFDIHDQPFEKSATCFADGDTNNYDDDDDDHSLAIIRPRTPVTDTPENILSHEVNYESIDKNDETLKTEMELYRQDSDGDTYLHIAVTQNHHKLPALINAMRNESLDVQNKLGQSPLHLAVLLHNESIVNQLVNSGASISVMDFNGDTPLHLACRICDQKLLCCVIGGESLHPPHGRDAALKTRNYNGESPLHIAAEKGGSVTMAINVLLTSNCDINIRNGKTGKTCLYMALENDDFKLAEYFLGKGADVNVEAYSGSSPLHLACQSGNAYMVQRLLDKSASLYAKNVDFESVKDVAANDEIKELVEKAMKKERRKRQKISEERHAPRHSRHSRKKTRRN